MQPTPIYDVSEPEALQKACDALVAGEVIALPTDTVYGFACDANNERAIQKLYAIKGRDFHKPVAICVKDLDALRYYGEAKHLNEMLLERLLPGPITIVIERSLNLKNRFLNPTTSRIGFRIPDYSFIQELCAMFRQPLALTSANISSAPSSLHIGEFQTLWPQLGAVFDAGHVGLTEDQRLASTVVDLTSPGHYKIIREGIALNSTLKVLCDHNLKPLEDDNSIRAGVS